MDKKKTKKQSPKAILAEVTKEMAKPRVAMSAREHSRIQEQRSSRLHLHYPLQLTNLLAKPVQN